MNEFTAKYGDQIQGVLSGFDRLVFRGSLRKICYVFGMKGYLWANQILLKDFGAHVQQTSERVKQASLRCVLEAGRIVKYLQSSQDDKEAIARSIASEQRIIQGPVCALSCVEPCWGFDIHRNGETKELELVQRPRIRAGLGYRKQDNCFPWVADWEQAQPLMDRQLQTKWPRWAACCASN